MENNQYARVGTIREKVIITNEEMFLHESIIRALVPSETIQPSKSA
tara:strand:+ start:22844 stop:22981 length:138 start_codon:yes stop_codon:yes gene_type:complete